jgi:hypothetical protein
MNPKFSVFFRHYVRLSAQWTSAYKLGTVPDPLVHLSSRELCRRDLESGEKKEEQEFHFRAFVYRGRPTKVRSRHGLRSLLFSLPEIPEIQEIKILSLSIKIERQTKMAFERVKKRGDQGCQIFLGA